MHFQTRGRLAVLQSVGGSWVSGEGGGPVSSVLSDLTRPRGPFAPGLGKGLRALLRGQWARQPLWQPCSTGTHTCSHPTHSIELLTPQLGQGHQPPSAPRARFLIS